MFFGTYNVFRSIQCFSERTMFFGTNVVFRIMFCVGVGTGVLLNKGKNAIGKRIFYIMEGK